MCYPKEIICYFRLLASKSFTYSIWRIWVGLDTDFLNSDSLPIVLSKKQNCKLLLVRKLIRFLVPAISVPTLYRRLAIIKCVQYCRYQCCGAGAGSVVDPDPQGSKTFCRIRIRNSRLWIRIRPRIRN
jgi:hypothetical protein